jgi:hypothetical protein
MKQTHHITTQTKSKPEQRPNRTSSFDVGELWYTVSCAIARAYQEAPKQAATDRKETEIEI